MNRPIKFRAWDNVNKKWLLGYDIPNLGGFHIDGECLMMGAWSQVLERTVAGEFGEHGEELKIMQSTGLKDKNGVEIFEGDLMECNYCKDDCGQVVWGSSIPGFRIKWEETCCANARLTRIDDWATIVGNIYQNPELLGS